MDLLTELATKYMYECGSCEEREELNCGIQKVLVEHPELLNKALLLCAGPIIEWVVRTSTQYYAKQRGDEEDDDNQKHLHLIHALFDALMDMGASVDCTNGLYNEHLLFKAIDPYIICGLVTTGCNIFSLVNGRGIIHVHAINRNVDAIRTIAHQSVDHVALLNVGIGNPHIIAQAYIENCMCNSEYTDVHVVTYLRTGRWPGSIGMLTKSVAKRTSNR